MAIASGLPKPRVWVVPDDDPNAFATGRDAALRQHRGNRGTAGDAEPGRAPGRGRPRDGARAQPRRAAHDPARGHGGRDRADVRRHGPHASGSAVAAAIELGGRGSGGGKGGGNPLATGRAGALAHHPDRGAGGLPDPGDVGEPEAGVSGRRDRRAVHPEPDGAGRRRWRSCRPLPAPPGRSPAGAAHLCIVDPSPGLLSSREGFLADVLASHPPIQQRIIRLQGMGYQQAKQRAAAGRRMHYEEMSPAAASFAVWCIGSGCSEARPRRARPPFSASMPDGRAELIFNLADPFESRDRGGRPRVSHSPWWWAPPAGRWRSGRPAWWIWWASDFGPRRFRPGFGCPQKTCSTWPVPWASCRCRSNRRWRSSWPQC